MSVQKLTEYMDFMKSVKEDTMLNCGNNLLLFSHIYLYVHWYLTKFYVCMEGYLRIFNQSISFIKFKDSKKCLIVG
jgi:hypothetical protein